MIELLQNCREAHTFKLILSPLMLLDIKASLLFLTVEAKVCGVKILTEIIPYKAQ